MQKGEPMMCLKTLITILAVPAAMSCAEARERAATKETKPVAAEQPAAAPQPPADPPPAVVSAADLPPRQKVEGEGITITEFVDGRINIKTTAIWNEAIDTTFDSCEYYRRAIPVLERQVSPERAVLLSDVCATGAPKKKPAQSAAKKAPRKVTAAPVAPKAAPTP